jgi:hypothetical protein
MTLPELQSHMLLKHTDLWNKLHEISGWRGLFDKNSHEWDSSTVEQKISVLRQIMEIYPLATIINAYRIFNEEKGERCRYIVLALPDALKDLRDGGLLEATL